MRDKLHNDEFEDYLQEQVKNHRMYAADGIWRNIQNTLHVEKSWHALTFTSIIIIAALTAGTLFIKPNTNLLKSQYHPATQATLAVSEKENKTSTEILRRHLSAENITTQTIAEAAQDLAIQSVTNQISQTQQISFSDADGSVVMITPGKTLKYTAKTAIDYSEAGNYLPEIITAQQKNSEQKGLKYSVNPYGAYSYFSFMQPLVLQKKNNLFVNSFSSKNNFFFKSTKNSIGYWLSLPAYSNENTGKMSRWDYQVYAAPSASYRRLYDITTKHSPETFISALPVDTKNYVIDVNKSVKHKPGIGFEAGVAVGYKLTPQLTLRTGFQFNMRQYTIEASSLVNTDPSNDFSTVVLPDSMNAANRNIPSANSTIMLNDRYLEISMPLGLDWKAVSLKNVSIGVAASVQPTYTFAKQPFIITSDFKSYANGSSLMRNWNINTTFQTYFAYKLGSYTWQIGPQFRYQQLPTFNTQYPVREHLLDYGLKIGFTKSIK